MPPTPLQKPASAPKPPMSMDQAFTSARAAMAPSEGPEMVTCPQCGATFDAQGMAGGGGGMPPMGGGAAGGMPPLG